MPNVNDKYKAEISPGRLGWNIGFTQGFSDISYMPWRPTRKRAEQHARKMIAKWEKQDARRKRGTFVVE